MDLVPPFIHPLARVESSAIGTETRVWAFAHILSGAVIGAGCNICDHCFIENQVRIGDHCVIKNGVSLWDGITLGDRVFVGPHAVFTNDHRPRAKAHHFPPAETILSSGATIGAGAVIVAPRRIGRYAFIGAGAVVTHDVPDHAMVVGNPARFLRWVCRCGATLDFNAVDSARCGCGDSYSLDHDRVVCR
ncbi:MAG: N-acetyltransferase [Magnetococcales bacterium]|nr:N-acetyltransferase [Magnetococcales bacterium]